MKRRFSGRARGLGALVTKCLVLAAADGLAVWLALAADLLSYGGKFPWVLLNLLWTLVLTDGAALLYPVVKGRIGRGYARRWMGITGGYCLLGVLLTPLVYRRLSREPTADGLRQVIIELLDIAEQLKLREKQEAD